MNFTKKKSGSEDSVRDKSLVCMLSSRDDPNTQRNNSQEIIFTKIDNGRKTVYTFCINDFIILVLNDLIFVRLKLFYTIFQIKAENKLKPVQSSLSPKDDTR